MFLTKESKLGSHMMTCSVSEMARYFSKFTTTVKNWVKIYWKSQWNSIQTPSIVFAILSEIWVISVNNRWNIVLYFHPYRLISIWVICIRIVNTTAVINGSFSKKNRNWNIDDFTKSCRPFHYLSGFFSDGSAADCRWSYTTRSIKFFCSKIDARLIKPWNTYTNATVKEHRKNILQKQVYVV